MNVLLGRTARDVTELFEDPSLTVACVMLIVVSLGYVLVTRLIARKIRRAQRWSRVSHHDSVRPPRDVWSAPP